MATSSSPIVLVTGINGFIASTTVNEFIDAGFRVRGTVRSLSKHQAALSRAFQHHIDNGTLDVVEVADYSAPGAFDAAVQGVVGICHIAVPGMRREDCDDIEANLASANGMVSNILQSADRHAGPQLASFVFTTSMAAMMRLDDAPGYRYTGDEFNPGFVDMARGLGAKSPVGLNYAAVKASTEQTFWDFVNDPARESKFVGTSIAPSFVLGPIAFLPENPRDLPAGVQCTWHVLGGGAWLADFGTPAFVDVRDVARAYVLGVREPEKTKGLRLLLSAYKAKSQAQADILRDAFPDRRDVIKVGNPGEGYPADHVTWGDDEVGFDGSRYEKLSGTKYTPFREAVVATAKSMLPWIEAGRDKDLSDEEPKMWFSI